MSYAEGKMSGRLSRRWKKACNHYIAGLLLNRFSSRIKRKGKRKKWWILQVETNNIPLEINTKDMALSKYFYGKFE